MSLYNIQPLNIKELLSEHRYLIPIYQRNYDWSEKEALQLIEDIADYAAYKNECKYYIGSVVVFVRSKDGEDFFETIDGQQRLTTLNILMNLLRTFEDVKGMVAWYQRANLSYDHRKEADEALRMLAENKLYDHPAAGSIAEVYRVMEKHILNILNEKGLSMIDFYEYLVSKVIIMRIPVPKDTELNHYFEIMNSRGEQLEKHEVLKASLMDNLDKSDYKLFNDIWEACADMTAYVQMKMSTKVRKLFFTDKWDDLQLASFDDYKTKYIHLDDNKEEDEDEYILRSIAELFEDAKNNVTYELPSIDREGDKGYDRFGSVINIPNFLLHVLKIMYQKDEEYNKNVNAEIKLDDKRLIDIFANVLTHCADKRAFVKRYIVALLHVRHIFDSFIIKREYYNGKEAWSLKSLRKYDGSKTNYVGSFSGNDKEDDQSKEIRMLEAMFHVSAPTQIYKHWLNAVLYFLYQQEVVKADKLREYLYTLACTYMVDRYLCVDKESRIEFEDIIYLNNALAANTEISWNAIDNGCSVENFIFNYYDYLTWKQNPQKYNKFEFTYRTSVEHFYPQTPMAGHKKLDESSGLHDFGNLCLISRGMNSKFSNNMPNAKCDNFGRDEALKELSIKLIEMMDVVRDMHEWSTPEIRDFEQKSRKRILQGIIDGCNQEITVID